MKCIHFKNRVFLLRDISKDILLTASHIVFMEVYVVGILKFQKAHFVEGGMLKSSGEAPRAIPSI